MRLLRNREILRMLTAMLVLAAGGVAACFFIAPKAGWVAGALASALIVVFLLYTQGRYRELDRLAAFLLRVVEGDYGLDIRDNDEGELSILKSEIYKVTVMLREQAAALRKEKGNLADALSDISHQLKTPLTSMFVMTDLLCGELPEAKRVEFTNRLRSQLERIQWLLSCLLKLSRLDAGVVEFKREAVPLSRLVEAACEPLLIGMELKEHTLAVDCPPLLLACDFHWTTEALVNILKNCLEHTPRGGVIRISAEVNPLYTEVAVADDGPGIDPEDLPHIFRRFYRGKNAAEDSIGIGLAMAKGIIVGQGGSVQVKSDYKGSRFLLRFHRGMKYNCEQPQSEVNGRGVSTN